MAATTAATSPKLDASKYILSSVCSLKPRQTEAPNRDRVSRALGAAFLSHQVDNLQRSVEDMSFSRAPGGPTRGMYSGPCGRSASPSPPVKAAQNTWPAPGGGVAGNRGRGRGSPGRGYANAVTGSRGQSHRDRERERQRRADEDKEFDRSLPVAATIPPRAIPAPIPSGRALPEVVDDRDLPDPDQEEREIMGIHGHGPQAMNPILSWRVEVARDADSVPILKAIPSPALDAVPIDYPVTPEVHTGPAVPAGVNPLSFQRRLADRIVLDSSVLVHSLGTVRKWCGEGRKEEVVVPLEALNTLDLLKKGSSPLAGSARAASRYLEDQVGINPRITVQGEEAYIPWEQIPSVIPLALVSSISQHTRTASVDSSPALGPGPLTTLSGLRTNKIDCPDWIKRTLCSAAFEFVNALHQQSWGARKSVLAVIAPQGDRLRGDDDTQRWEGRADGREVRAWAQEMNILLLELGKTPRAERERRSVDSDRERFGRAVSGASGGRGGAFGGRGRGRGKRGGRGAGSGTEAIVDKPVQEAPRVIKVLARGERLDT
ncbi:hypothetical protein DACRYDRAFT_118855 [Dacryopinax primogenitus]|uniref:PIN domain-containing protein n=1 Tax=Dacryopinax primogenitus (strain DJM 731) TaxID=1858805 RepID=M5FNZ3_DACPD|nr:uncharacterized protein DACRYDRAFT_118855 [Dacryopinax primogenitus]EJT98085.1 hypothetical protein DACRYDRAFT_118855 [Dacryopinax primogenitus]